MTKDGYDALPELLERAMLNGVTGNHDRTWIYEPDLGTQGDLWEPPSRRKEILLAVVTTLIIVASCGAVLWSWVSR